MHKHVLAAVVEASNNRVEIGVFAQEFVISLKKCELVCAHRFGRLTGYVCWSQLSPNSVFTAMRRDMDFMVLNHKKLRRVVFHAVVTNLTHGRVKCKETARILSYF